MALQVDQLLGKQEVVIKTLGERFKDLKGVAGGAIIGDGKVELLLMDGVFLRAIHHMQRPISLIKAILANTNQEPPNKCIHPT